MKRSVTVKSHRRNGKVVKSYKRIVDGVIDIAHNVVRKLKHNAEDFIAKGNEYQDALDRLDRIKELRAKQDAAAKETVKADVVAKYKSKRNLLDKLSGYRAPVKQSPINTGTDMESLLKKNFGANYKKKYQFSKMSEQLQVAESKKRADKKVWQAEFDRNKALREKANAKIKPQIDGRKK